VHNKEKRRVVGKALGLLPGEKLRNSGKRLRNSHSKDRRARTGGEQNGYRVGPKDGSQPNPPRVGGESHDWRVGAKDGPPA
jgi:hypothetical protein